MFVRKIFSLCAVCLLVTGCGRGAEQAPAENTASAETESDRVNVFLDAAFKETLGRNPEWESELGFKEHYDEWNDLSEEKAEEDLALVKRQLEVLRSFDSSRLDPATKLSFQLFERQAEDAIAHFPWRHYDYPVNPLSGVQADVPAFLINVHKIDSLEDAEAYISRLSKMRRYFRQAMDGLTLRSEKGILAPKFVYPQVLEGARNIISGRPFDDSDQDSTLLADFKSKVSGLTVNVHEEEQLIAEATRVLREEVGPAYEELISFVAELAEEATSDDGAWKFPDGEAFYAHELKQRTTTELTAGEIHDIGLREVARIHTEMKGIIEQVGFEGGLQDFFSHLRSDPKFYYEEGPSGRQAYVEKAAEIIERMSGQLDQLFNIRPKAELVVKAVEPFREKSAGKAFYERPAADGSRPGTYYANLYRTSNMPIYQMEALAYHEGIPGHHMQIAIAMEQDHLPMFRRYGRYTAYSEGWGLYSELIPKEIGFYEDPYSDFGRLAMELWRAARLVVDTGIHFKKWTREEAIQYLTENTPNPQGDIVKAIERYIIWPGQATAYKIGMLKILELRTRASDALGDRFDIREFHDVVLKTGPVPLTVLEELVDDYVRRKINALDEVSSPS